MIWVFLHFVRSRLVRNSVTMSSDSRERRCLVYLGLIDGICLRRDKRTKMAVDLRVVC